MTDEQARDVCPNDWKVRGYVRSSHSMFHPAMHECVRGEGHAGRCRCFCGSTTEKYSAREKLKSRMYW